MFYQNKYKQRRHCKVIASALHPTGGTYVDTYKITLVIKYGSCEESNVVVRPGVSVGSD